MNIYRLISIVTITIMAIPSFSQVSNDNEDEVNKVDIRFAQHDYVPGQVLVKFKDKNRVQVNASRGLFRSTNVNSLTTLFQKYGAKEMEPLLADAKPKRQLKRAKAYNGDVIQERDLSQLFLVKLSDDYVQETMQLVDELKGIDEVEFAEPNYRVYAMADTHIADEYSGNPLMEQQWYLDAYGVKELWNKPVINKERPIIAILDTGVDLTHPDLKDNLWTNIKEEYGTKDNDNDGNGFKNDVHGWDFVNNTGNIRDNNMHGTHVAGIAAAANNGIGIVGANPQALIMPITVLQSDGAGDVATIVKGIEYAVENGAKIINMSFGLYSNSLVLRHALENAYHEAVLVAAAGNDGRCIYASHWLINHFDPEPRSMSCFPAAYSFVLGVQATEKGGTLAAFSNYDDDGSTYSCESSYGDPDGFNYELKAPGKQMLSTIPGGNYKPLNGTSMAAPLVAGAISALQMVKQYDTQEVLWGDLLHTNNIAQAYNMTERPAVLDVMKVELRERKELTDMTEDDYGGDNEVDAGETVKIYPVIRTTFGAANNIRLRLMIDEFEDPDVVEIISGDVDFGIHLDAYGKGVSQNPLILNIPNNIADARHIKLRVVAICDEMTEEASFPITLVVHNMIKLHGLINEDMKLTSNHVYYIDGNLGVNKGATLTIEPGTRLEFAEGAQIRAFGKLVAKGTPGNLIVFTRHAGEGKWNGINTHASEGIHRHSGIYTNNDTTLFTLIQTENTPIKIQSIIKNIYYGLNEKNPSKTFYLYDYMGGDGWNYFTPNMSGKEHLFQNPEYLTPPIHKMLTDINDYCSKYASIQTDDKTESASVSARFTENDWVTYDNPADTISFCRIEDCEFHNDSEYPVPFMYDCILDNCKGYSSGGRNVFIGGIADASNPAPRYNVPVMKHTNFINNKTSGNVKYSYLYENNFFNNFATISGNTYTLGIDASSPTIDHATLPSYLGTGREDLVRSYLYEMGNSDDTWGTVDLSNMPKEPYKEAHGIVWKVLVNGKDAQDEFEDLAPLGVGKHKFEVYFNRPMNKEVAPQITFGIRSPYTQQNVVEDGSWNEEGTIYTAYKTINGKTMSDGLNRIYVQGAEDNEYIMCPYENIRFNVIIQAAGSLSTGFMAEPGLGQVHLTWDVENNNYEDALGFNIYRTHQTMIPSGYQNGKWHDKEIVNDTVRLNENILDIETTSYTDDDVMPGETYHYYYKVLSTDLQEYDMSNIVAATPLTSTRGDANGSGAVDVADVITTANYVARQNPKPFIFEAADVNNDKTVDILDVIGIVRGILNPSLLASISTNDSATYMIENGTLYVESPVALAGVQVQVSLDERCKKEEVRTALDLDGFEQASAWLSDNDYLMLAYSMNGRTLSPGKHAVMTIGNADITSIRLADVKGNNVVAVPNDVTLVKDAMGSKVMTTKGVYNLSGQKIVNSKSSNRTLPKGVYIINGKKVVK